MKVRFFSQVNEEAERDDVAETVIPLDAEVQVDLDERGLPIAVYGWVELQAMIEEAADEADTA